MPKKEELKHTPKRSKQSKKPGPVRNETNKVARSCERARGYHLEQITKTKTARWICLCEMVPSLRVLLLPLPMAEILPSAHSLCKLQRNTATMCPNSRLVHRKPALRSQG